MSDDESHPVDGAAREAFDTSDLDFFHELVTGMRRAGPPFRPSAFVAAAYAASIRDRGSGSTKVRAGRCIP